MWERIKKYGSTAFLYALGAFVVLNLVIYFFGLLIYLDVLTFFDKTYNFFTALSGLASVFVAVVAIIISLKTSRQQKELQLRQIKLDSFNLRYECWNILKFLYELMLHFKNDIDSYKRDPNLIVSIILNYYGINDYDATNDEKFFYILQLEINGLKESHGIKNLNMLSQIKFVIKDNENIIDEIITEIIKLYSIFSLPLEKTNYEGIFFLFENFCRHKDKIKKMLEQVEKDLNISELHKISDE